MKADDDMDIFLDDLLDSQEDLPLTVDEGLDDLVTNHPVQLKPAPEKVLDGVVTDSDLDEGEVSFLAPYSSSLLENQPRQIRFRHLAAMDLREHPVRLARTLLAEAEACKPPDNPIDELLGEGQIRELVAALQQAEARVLEGGQVTLIITPGQHTMKPISPAERMALHYNAMPVGGVCIIRLEGTELQLHTNLLRRGVRHGQDYELCDNGSLMPYERKVLRALTSRTNAPMRILRRLSRRQAKTGK